MTSCLFFCLVKAGSKRSFLYKSAALTLTPILWGFSPAVSAINNLTIISSSTNEFHFVVQFDNQLSSLNHNLGNDSLLYLSRAIQIAVPYGATPRIVSVQGNTLSAIDKSSLGSEYGQKQIARQQLSQLSNVRTMRNRQFVTLNISPVNGDNFYNQVEVKLTFENADSLSGGVSNDPKFDRIFASTIANWTVAQNWPSVPKAAAKSAYQPGPFSVSADWYKIAVTQSGIHSMTFDQLRNAGLLNSSVPSADIYMYYGGGLQVNPILSAPRPTFEQIAISIEDGGDGNFQPGDRILFYGESLNRWRYDSAGANYINNVYSTQNIYWLAVSSGITETPLRMITLNAAPTGTAIDTFNTYVNNVHLQQENLLRSVDGIVGDYYNWYWSAEDSLDVFIPAANVVPGQTSDIFIAAKTYDQTGSGDAIGYVDLSVNTQPGLSKNCNFDSCTYQTNSLISGLNRFSMRLHGFTASTLSIAPHFDYIELSYHRTTVPIGPSIDASFGPNAGLFRVDITDNFTAIPLIFGLSNTYQPTRLTGAVRTGGLVSFEALFALNSSNRFFAVASNALLSPASINRVLPADLHAGFSQTDLIVIAPSAYMPAMAEYIAYRSSQGYSIQTASIEDIMDNFGFGLYDPSAIRDFLKYAYENFPTPAPSAVLFAGDANYDFIDRLQTGVPNIVPPYLFQYDNTLSDDNFVYFGQYGLIDSDTSFVDGDRGFDMIAARWPVNSVSEINRIVAKIKAYESSTAFGNWRTNITLVSDDEIHPNSTSNPPLVEAIHTIQTEQLSINNIPNTLNKNKIYAWEYPVVNREKPEVNTAIVNEINDGTLIVNYVGHGSPDLWAHEHIFSRTADLPRLTNSARLPLFFAASCAISFFDDPKREGMAEDLLSMNSGAIGIIAATRLVYSAENSAFNRRVFGVLLYDDSLTICESLYAAKLMRQYVSPTNPVPNTNDRNYLYFGDPYLRLALPRLNVMADSTLDSLTALQPVRITGRITDDFGANYISDGQLIINVYDSERNRTHRIGNTNSTFSYNVKGPSMFRGSATITGGAFDFTFVPPLDIGYGGRGARVSLYAALDTVDAMGIIDSIAISNAVTATTDSTGPAISASFSGKPLEPGGNVIQFGEILTVTLTDSSGINLTGGIGHGITLQTDNDASSLKNLTDLFQYFQDDYTSGSLIYTLDSLEPGLHTFKIKAWDNANNSSTLEFAAEITTNSELAIQDLLNYPNPMSDHTNFSFSLTRPVSKFLLEIFTLAGRKINSFDRYALAPAYYDDIVWDGRDAYGDRVATGVYLYKATALPESGGQVEEFGKVILINQ